MFGQACFGSVSLAQGGDPDDEETPEEYIIATPKGAFGAAGINETWDDVEKANDFFIANKSNIRIRFLEFGPGALGESLEYKNVKGLEIWLH